MTYGHNVYPPPQRQPGENKNIFLDNLADLEKKFAHPLFPEFPDTLEVTRAFTIEELQQLVILRPHLGFRKIENRNIVAAPDCSTSLVFVDLLRIQLSYVRKKRLGNLAINGNFLPHIWPVLPYTPTNYLSIIINDNGSLNLTDKEISLLASIENRFLVDLKLFINPNFSEYREYPKIFSVLFLSHLKSISLDGFNPTEEHTDLISTLLPKCKGITNLMLSSDASLAPPTLKAFQTLVSGFTGTLEKLNLSINLTDEHLPTLANKLQDMAATESFEIGQDNQINNITPIVVALPFTNINEFAFTFRTPGSYQIESLVEACEKPDSKLKALKFWKYELNKDTIDLICNLIQNSRNLTLLSFCTDLYIKAGNDRIPWNKKEIMSMPDDAKQFVIQCVKKLVSAMSHNFSLTSCDLVYSAQLKLMADCIENDIPPSEGLQKSTSLHALLELFETMLECNQWLAEKRKALGEIDLQLARFNEQGKAGILKLTQICLSPMPEVLEVIKEYYPNYYEGFLEQCEALYNSVAVQISQPTVSVSNTGSPRLFRQIPQSDIQEDPMKVVDHEPAQPRQGFK